MTGSWSTCAGEERRTRRADSMGPTVPGRTATCTRSVLSDVVRSTCSQSTGPSRRVREGAVVEPEEEDLVGHRSRSLASRPSEAGPAPAGRENGRGHARRDRRDGWVECPPSIAGFRLSGSTWPRELECRSSWAAGRGGVEGGRGRTDRRERGIQALGAAPFLPRRATAPRPLVPPPSCPYGGSARQRAGGGPDGRKPPIAGSRHHRRPASPWPPLRSSRPSPTGGRRSPCSISSPRT